MVLFCSWIRRFSRVRETSEIIRLENSKVIKARMRRMVVNAVIDSALRNSWFSWAMDFSSCSRSSLPCSSEAF